MGDGWDPPSASFRNTGWKTRRGNCWVIEALTKFTVNWNPSFFAALAGKY